MNKRIGRCFYTRLWARIDQGVVDERRFGAKRVRRNVENVVNSRLLRILDPLHCSFSHHHVWWNDLVEYDLSERWMGPASL